MIDLFNMTDAQNNMLNDLHIPKDIYYERSIVYQFWFRSLLHKINSSIIFDNLPKGWDEDFLMYCLWLRGYVAVFKTNIKSMEKYGENGILFSPCYASGMDFYYEPTDISIVNPVYQPKGTLKNHKDAELLKLTPDYFGVMDIITRYAEQLSELSKGIDMSILNTKFAIVFEAENEAQSASLKAVVDSIQAGNPYAFYKNTNSKEVMPKKDPFQVFNQEMGKNYILNKQLDDLDHILNQFYTEIGISSTMSIEKKERLVTAEAEFAGAQSQARISSWIRSLEQSLDIINDKYNTKIGVSYAINTDKPDPDGRTAKQGKQVDK